MAYPGTRQRRLKVRKQTMGRSTAPPRTPLLPHEHDESPEPAASEPSPVERQAHDDVARGLVDTERRQDAVKVFERSLGARKRTVRLINPR